MQLEKFKIENKKKKAIIIGSIVLVFLITILVLYRSFALFEENQAFDVIKGSVPNQNYDLMISFQIEDENGNRRISETIPDDRNYEVNIECNNGASGEWIYEEWSPKINNLTSTRTKCTMLFTKRYKESILNGMDPVLKEGLIPVIIENDGTVKKANERAEWYDYETQKWANAVVLEDESISYQNGEVIPENNIESYFVWIPKYRYKLWDLGNYEGLTNINPNKVHDIEIIFGDYDTVDEKSGECKTPGVSGETGNCSVGDYMTHPAFQAFGTKGLWVGKFETGYKKATSTKEAEQNLEDIDKVEIKPNVYSWRGIQVANAHLNSYNYKREYESHMMKNTEWGAVAYLQHSVYGSRAKVRINNNSNSITGYSAVNEPNTGWYSYSDYEMTNTNVNGTKSFMYNSLIGYLASTTGNISGIYDMSGGSSEYVMGIMLRTNQELCVGRNAQYTSGFDGLYCEGNERASGIKIPERKYFDIYSYHTNATTYQRRILGDATGEIGPFNNIIYGNQKQYENSWYHGIAYMIHSTNSWFGRGGNSASGISAGVDGFQCHHGDVFGGFRVVLAI